MITFVSRSSRAALGIVTATAALGLTLLSAPSGTAASAASAPAVAPAPVAAPSLAKVKNSCVRSRPDRDTGTEVNICYTMFKPRGASRKNPVPMILHSHGWGGSRTREPEAFKRFLNAGYGVMSFDQRGFGASGGHARVMHPAFEGLDVRKLVKVIARQQWVVQDGKGDPRLGAIGGSYGGGFQFVGAFELLRIKGKPVFDALAPQITWFDLYESLGPVGVTRTEWALALSAAGVPTNALERRVYEGLVEGGTTSDFPDGTGPTGIDLVEYFRQNGPKWHVSKGRKLNIPMLFGQGTTDTLFPLEQGLQNWNKSITRKARRNSIFIGYNGGHVLPQLLPQGVSVTSDPCSTKLNGKRGGDFEALTRKFFDHALKGKKRKAKGYGKVHLATPDSTCTTRKNASTNRLVQVGQVATLATAGPPAPYLVAEGPIRIAGNAHLTGTLTAAGVYNRAFYGLAVGSTPLDARLIQNNVLPLNEQSPVVGERRRVDLPAVAVDVPAGQNLYLVATPLSDTFVGMGSRTPGAVILENTKLALPVVK